MLSMRSLSESQAAFFAVVAQTITPGVASLDADGRVRMMAIVDTALQDRDASTQKQFNTFLRVIRFAPVVRYGRTFDRLAPEQKETVLRWFESCPVSLLRKGFWGLKALVFMGYYGRPESWSEIGYAPKFDGRAKVRHA
jgi:hypothetical protein